MSSSKTSKVKQVEQQPQLSTIRLSGLWLSLAIAVIILLSSLLWTQNLEDRIMRLQENRDQFRNGIINLDKRLKVIEGK